MVAVETIQKAPLPPRIPADLPDDLDITIPVAFDLDP